METGIELPHKKFFPFRNFMGIDKVVFSKLRLGILNFRKHVFRDYIYYLFKWELKLIYKIVLFLILNFAALGIGGFLMGEGPMSNWYQSINQAPWTPPVGFWICMDNNYDMLFFLYELCMGE